MKKSICFLMIMLSSIVFSQNLLFNSKFESELSQAIPNIKGTVDTQKSWIKHENGGGKGKIEIVNGKILGVSENLDAPIHGLQLIQAPLKLEAGGIYKLKFIAESEKNEKLTLKVGADGDRGYYAYWYNEIQISPTQKEYEYTFEMLAEEDEKARFEIWFTKAETPVKLTEFSLEKIGNIETERMIALVKFNNQKEYKVDQVGKNILTEENIQKIKTLKTNDELRKNVTLEEEGRYLVKLIGISQDEKYEVGLKDGESRVLDFNTDSCILKFGNKTRVDGEFYIKKLSNTKTQIENILFEKYIGKIVWEEEFNYTGLPDEKIWSYEVGGHGWGNSELQYYKKADKENVYVRDGKLVITALKKDYEGKKYTSTRLITKGKKDFLYGRIEVTAKLPSGRGTWPAIWMMPTNSQYGEWPKSGEIDIMEHVGYEEGIVHGTVHTEKYYWVKSNQKGNQIEISDATKDFHTYSLEWTPNIIKMYKDDSLYFIYENEKEGKESWPFDQKFFLIFNIAIGGAWGGQQGVDDTIFPQSLEIDKIRVYELEN
ncbi:glycoside hydrolase family 16 protein [Fusobacterium sp.]|uniref:glycoside hydrolase family 16 protein n=1 Tax=Fusobacterium sp. TaxID=68766 RepID=UPI00261BD8A9|nr:glycoside hydrolase family 16 protein [Fusobacterium sp.]